MINMKARLVLLLLLFFGLGSLHAQVQDRFKTKKPDTTAATTTQDPKEKSATNKPLEQEKFLDKVIIGGNASLSFGTFTFIYLAPTVGYKFTDNLVAGPGFIYQYTRIAARNINGVDVGVIQSSIYGPKAFANYIFADRVYGGLQYEYLNHQIPFVPTGSSRLEFVNTWTSVLFIEAGLISRFGGKGYAQLGMRYNVLHGPDSPYASPFFPFIGFFF